VRAPYGGGIYGRQTHSQSPEAIFAQFTGLKTVIFSNPYDAKGLLIAAIEDDDPVIFLEPKRVYNGPFDGRRDSAPRSWLDHPKSEVPDGHYSLPLGKASIVRKGLEITVLAYGTMVHVALAAIKDSAIDAEPIDLRSIVPLDIDAIVQSVSRTGRCVIVHEASRFGGFGGELSALVQERCFHCLESPIRRVAGWDTPYPHAFEWDYFPSSERVVKAMRQALSD
jgi:2-oxoisovalerate dehydrogenase E1 component beta subunit